MLFSGAVRLILLKGIHAVTKVYLLVKYIHTVKCKPQRNGPYPISYTNEWVLVIPFPFSGLFCMPAAMDNRLLNIVFGLLLASIASEYLPATLGSRLGF